MKAKKTYKFEPDYAVAPGRLIREYLELKNITIEDGAKQTRINLEIFKEILAGTQAITYEIAEKLEAVNEISSDTWLAMDKIYWEQKKKLEKLQK